MVSTGSVLIFGFNLLFSIAVPVILMIVLKKKYHTSFTVFCTGAATFIVFALILEQLLHMAVLASPTGTMLQENIWLYGLYGGLAAGLFEETGRYISMKYLLKKKHDNSYNSLMFGAGHGGCEMVLIFGVAMINNIAYAVMINSGQTETVLAALPEKQRAAVQTVFDTLITGKPYTYLLGDVERISAVIAHIAFSVFVWIAVTRGKKALYLLAIGLHFLMDFLSVALVQGLGMNVVVFEILLFVIADGFVIVARYFWKKNEMAPT